jgi:hypothetical protein
MQERRKRFEQIDQAIQVNDRRLLDHSEQRMNGEWVMAEICQPSFQSILARPLRDGICAGIGHDLRTVNMAGGWA